MVRTKLRLIDAQRPLQELSLLLNIPDSAVGTPEACHGAGQRTVVRTKLRAHLCGKSSGDLVHGRAVTIDQKTDTTIAFVSPHAWVPLRVSRANFEHTMLY